MRTIGGSVGHHHHHRQRIRGFGYFRRLGPELITGAADDDPSGIGTYSQVGAAFRFDFLWTALFTLPLAAAVQELAGRLGLVSGKGLATLIRHRFPRFVLYGSVALVSFANTFNIAADLRSMAASIRLVAPIPLIPLTIVVAITLLLVEVFVGYHHYSRLLRWLCVSLVAYIAVAVVIKVEWNTVLKALLVPQLHLDRSSLAALIAIFGTTISPYLFFWQAGEEIEEEREEQVNYEVDKQHIRAMRVDVVAGMFSAVVVMGAIMVAAAATLGAAGITNVQTADQAARALRPVAGNLAGLLFAAGIVGTGALAVPVLAGSTGYALAEAFGWNEGLSRRLREAPGFYAVIAGSVLGALVLGMVGIDPIRGLYYAAILNGLVAPPLIFLMWIVGRSDEVGRHRSELLSTALVLAAFVVMAGAPVAYLLL
jgi:NRAMP (natural resistance-associated macrophage protein)-like metal ion transporter